MSNSLTAEYITIGKFNLLFTALKVSVKPDDLILFITSFTSSGCCKAFETNFLFQN